MLEHHYEDMKTVGDSLIALTGITLRLYEDDYRDLQNDPLLLTAVFCFVTASAILLLNLLIAQLNCSYVYIYQNMLGYAKLKRSSVSVQTLAYIKMERWSRFVATLGLDVPLEFNEGDVGMAGGISAPWPATSSNKFKLPLSGKESITSLCSGYRVPFMCLRSLSRRA